MRLLPFDTLRVGYATLLAMTALRQWGQAPCGASPLECYGTAGGVTGDRHLAEPVPLGISVGG
ncbi:MAG: hypothetical protein OEV79_12200 [candidate division WOR-3 bacterium]|nr:hypothetical protein [candidate division WOR-3 bacterium]